MEFYNMELNECANLNNNTNENKAASKVEAIVKAPHPNNVIELSSFLGIVNFYARFLDKRSDNLKPLYELLNNKEFIWNENCEKAFLWVKSELISEKILAHYDPTEEIILACDASVCLL